MNIGCDAMDLYLFNLITKYRIRDYNTHSISSYYNLQNYIFVVVTQRETEIFTYYDSRTKIRNQFLLHTVDRDSDDFIWFTHGLLK